MMVEWKTFRPYPFGKKGEGWIDKDEAEEKLAEKDKEIERLKEKLVEERVEYMVARVNTEDVDMKEAEKEARAQIEKELSV